RPIAFLAVALIALAALSIIHPAYLSVVGLLTGHAFAFLPFRWALGHVLAIAAIVFARSAEFLGPAVVIGLALSLVVSLLLSLHIHASVRQSLERKALTADLEAARGDLARAEREAGTLAERQRIAGELHDTVTQDLVSIVRLLESAEGALAASPER